MDLIQTLSELREQKRQLDAAILVLEKIAAGQPRGKGRPPKWLSLARQGEDGTPAKRVLSEESRARMAEAQRKRWAARRETASDSSQ